MEPTLGGIDLEDIKAPACFYIEARLRERLNVTIGPILPGAAKPVHIMTPAATVRRLVNMTALSVVDANAHR